MLCSKVPIPKNLEDEIIALEQMERKSLALNWQKEKIVASAYFEDEIADSEYLEDWRSQIDGTHKNFSMINPPTINIYQLGPHTMQK